MTNAKVEASLPPIRCDAQPDELGDYRVIKGGIYCDGCWFECDACLEAIPFDDRASCDHWSVCKGCQDEGWCTPCALADHFYDEVDRQYAEWKERA